MAKKIIRRRGYVSEVTQFNSYVAQVNAASQGWSGQPPGADTLPDGLLRREYAWRKAELVSEVVVPVCHAAGYGVIGAGAGVFIARLGGLPLGETVLLCGGVSFAFAFIVTTKNMLRSMWTVEEFGSEEIEEEAKALTAPAREVKITLENESGTHTKFVDLHVARNPDKLISESQLARLATHCVLNKRNFSRPELCQRKSILSQSEYAILRDDMLKAGLLREAGGNNTVELSPSGRAVLRSFLD